ncbi:DrmE family protein [Microbulbifer sp. VAAC004]|uniref:DrmE family protein n=1 Tax=unclassified Microbulbifer TaxID=2619833 RepID=UPI00403B25C0
MDFQLTHKDRLHIRESLLNITLDPSDKDQSLIRNASLHLRNNPPFSSAERSYHQYTVDLINFLRRYPDDSRSKTIRRALKLLQSPGEYAISSVKAFIAGFALHEISDDGSLQVVDEIRGLSPKEKQVAESMLLDLASSSGKNDAEILEQTARFVASFGEGESTSLVTRFLRNIKKLTNVLTDSDEWTTEQKTWARGALSYLHLNEDTVPDDIGIIGLLDDMYVVATAMSFIGTIAQPIEEVISDLYTSWPFLRDLVVTYRETEYSYSEFSLINTALACPTLTLSDSLERSALILPVSGITPFIIAFGASLGAAYDAASTGDTPSFTLGQKVRADNNAIAIYDGIEECQGNNYIRLTRRSTRKGEKTEASSFIPVDQISRLSPAPDNAIPRGDIPTQIDCAEITLAGTEALFHLALPQQFNSVFSRIWLVSKVSVIRSLVSEVRLHGHPLSGVIPMGHIKKDGELQRWDSRFGTTECVLTTISDLDLAAEILEEQDLTHKDLVVIDLSGTNRNRLSALNQIHSLGTRVLCIAEEKDTDTISSLENNSYDFWEWSSREAKELFSSRAPNTYDAHPFSQNDYSVIRSLVLEPSVQVLNSSDAQKAKADLYHLDAEARKAGEDATDELLAIRDELFGISLELIRTPVVLTSLSSVYSKVIRSLSQLFEKTQKSLYLSTEEKALTLGVIESLRCFSLKLETVNLKEDAIIETVNSATDARVLAPPRFPANLSLLQAELKDGQLFLPWQKVHKQEYGTLIIPYWPGYRKAWEILSNPPARKILFILYSFEDEWRSAFYGRRERSKTKRAESSRRSAIFNGNYPWSPPPAYVPPFIDQRIADHALHEEQDFRFRQQVVHAALKEGEFADTEARMVAFNGSAHAFFTQEHEALSASHLIPGVIDENTSKDKLRPVKVKDLTEGDVLVFLHGANRDAIRELADAGLPHGMRKTAKLWQKSLKEFVAENRLSLAELKRRLEAAGCKRHIVTLKMWLESESLIGPRNYASGDLEAIVQVTGDKEFQEKMAECANAISKVWGEHLRVSRMIAERVLSSLRGRMAELVDLTAPLDVGDGLLLAQVEYVEDESVMVPLSTVNQLRESI